MQRIFAADIGGTHARFGSFFRDAAGVLACEAIAWKNSAELRTEHDVLHAMRSALNREPKQGDTLAIALAGPVSGLRGRLTNGRLRLDLAEIRKKSGLRHCVLLNDFQAEAHAVLTEAGEKARCITAGAHAPKTAARAVLGAGTGLGAAMLAPHHCPDCGMRWLTIPSEAGHTPFAFVGQEENAFHDFLRRALHVPWASAEHVLCGRGLALLHSHLSGHTLTPAEVGATALSDDTPTLRWYARFLARFCRQWICSTLCLGGLWITGGIAARNPLCVESPYFREELVLSPPLGALLRAVPVRLVVDRNSGLWGAARAGLTSPCGHTANGRK
ncbi:MULTISPECIES: glucokinase [unclassified Desulfovibrio]|uniref:glucokinase n=1 Tax=unclassified Desulfovibrio TaxID=2593640 RepID=UPI000F5E4878|nr:MULTISPECIES: glucokinase [unclassified Desulfovibrio]RRD72102.1 glucokinase [Desulfovibrio sp. OH1209_COT-279]RRD88257.1 glucokinase [Desulfovibrio sp. OH1186_COT-070]